MRKTIVKFILCVLVAGAIVKSTEGQQRCRTPSHLIGHCVPFQSCPLFVRMMEWVTPNELEIIEKSWCDTINDVRTICCPVINIPRSDEITTIKPSTSTTDLPIHPNAHMLQFHDCGKSALERISNGNVTKIFEFPWMAMLRTRSHENQFVVICGGTLISSRFVLTAAHCMRTAHGEIKIDSVVLGEHDTTTNPDCFDGECAELIQEIGVERSIPHPNFSMSNAKNDIGLIRLQRNVNFSDSVIPICIPYTHESQAINYKKLVVMGWGSTENGSSSNVLLKAILDITPNSECSTILEQRNRLRVQIDENILCAFDADSDTCHGDSGGPATFLTAIPTFGPRMFQYGIVSAGARICGQNNGVPGVYTRVTSYVQWILDNISE